MGSWTIRSSREGRWGVGPESGVPERDVLRVAWSHLVQRASEVGLVEVRRSVRVGIFGRDQRCGSTTYEPTYTGPEDLGPLRVQEAFGRSSGTETWK